MASEMETLFQKILETLRPEVTEVSFQTWFLGIKPLHLSENTLILGVNSEVTRNMLSSRYRDLLVNACRVASGIPDFKVEITDIAAEAPSFNEEEDKKPATPPDLNTRYTFDNFVVGNSNRFAHAAALAAAEAPGLAYNPLFLYGQAGLGKTHLMHAIGHFIASQNRSAKIVYISAETFTNEMITGIKENRTQEFRDKYRNVDVLLVDDIQFIAGKEGSQEEFFHTFNALYNDEKQIILTSDRPPKEMVTLEDRLRSRFEWGLIADIQPPDFETRVAILQKKAQSKNYELENDMLGYIASNVKSNIRELEGALNQIIAYSSVTNRVINFSLIDEALKDYFKDKAKKEITPDLILKTVANHYGIKEEELKGDKRNKIISYPRQIAMYLMRDMLNMTLPKIGEYFNRDHTTVLHGAERIIKDIETDPYIRDTVETIKGMILSI